MKLFWKISGGFVVVLALCFGGAWWSASELFAKHYRQEMTRELGGMAQTLAFVAAASGGREAAAAHCSIAAKATGARFTLVEPGGQVLADSDEQPANMDNHAVRPEVAEARAGRTGVASRYSTTVRADMLYVAVPVRDPAGGGIVGVARAARPLTIIDQVVREHSRRSASTISLAAAAALLLSFWLARGITRPLTGMAAAAAGFGRGELQNRVPVPEDPDLAELACSLNQMAGQLAERIAVISAQSNRMNALLQSMTEGVFAVSADEHLLLVNPVAARMLDIEPAVACGRAIQETVRSTELQRLIGEVMANARPAAVETMLYAPGREQTVQANAAPLLDAAGRAAGVVVILNDITQLRRLETMRRDFVANVSHELRTPITALKGFVETLLEGAIAEPETARKFLNIIARHADRLQALTDDLLTLSRLENQQKLPMPMEVARLLPTLEAAVSLCAHKAEEKKIRIKLECNPEATVKMNAAVIEQAVTNLLNNAITYSNPESKVWVSGRLENGEVLIEVRDQGCGISSRDLPRIFERFYRVDQARSRAAGGTGLGLAIVKHAAQDHGGRVSVASEVGKGSTFTIHLPAAALADIQKPDVSASVGG